MIKLHDVLLHSWSSRLRLGTHPLRSVEKIICGYGECSRGADLEPTRVLYREVINLVVFSEQFFRSYVVDAIWEPLRSDTNVGR